MRIHTDKLEWAHFYAAARIAGVTMTTDDRKGSRSHARAFEIKISGSSNYTQNFGTDKAATWDEWGIFLAALFEADPNIKTPYYADRNDFHWQTGERFLTLTHDQQHKRHRWDANCDGTFTCNKCDASMRNRYSDAMPEGYVAPKAALSIAVINSRPRGTELEKL